MARTKFADRTTRTLVLSLTIVLFCAMCALAISVNVAFADDCYATDYQKSLAQQVKGKNINSKGTVRDLWRVYGVSKNKPKQSKTINSFDLTGDSKADKVTLSLSGYKQKRCTLFQGERKTKGYSFSCTGIQVRVNGKKYGSIKLPRRTAGPIQVQLVTLKNKRSFLYAAEDNYYEEGVVYQVHKKRLKKVIRTNLVNGLLYEFGGVKVKGNTVLVTYRYDSEYLGGISYTLPYKIKRGLLRQASSIPMQWSYSIYDEYERSLKPDSSDRVSSLVEEGLLNLTEEESNDSKLDVSPVWKSFNVYTSTACKQVALTINRGTKVMADKIMVKNGRLFVHITCADGAGWVKDRALPKGWKAISAPIFAYCYSWNDEEMLDD